ncbi:MAG: carbohydrate ABC transporter permease [Nitrospinota bacterium]|nr:MAG: carbohydrate ABC transporter permease [Nitrospinota bacterium]
MNRLRRRSIHVLEALFNYAVLMGGVAFALFPLLWMLSTSLKTEGDYFADPPVWIPRTLDLSHYLYLFTKTDGLLSLKNSLILALATMLAALVFSIPMAYAIARFQVGGRKLPMSILMLRMMHPIALVFPLFLLYRQFRLLDTYSSLILTYTVIYLPFAIWLLIGFFRDFPLEIEEAAMIDGCSRLSALLRVVLPIVAPGIAVVALFAFVFTWNEFLFAVIFTKQHTKTMMVLTASFIQSPTDTAWGEAAAAVIVGIFPCVSLTFFLQRYLVRGLALGSVKG